MGGAVEQVVVTIVRFVVVVFYGSSLYVRRSSSSVFDGGVFPEVGENSVFHASGDGHPDSICVIVANAVFKVLLVVFEVVVHFLMERVPVVTPVDVGTDIKVVVLAVKVEVVLYVICKVGEGLIGGAGSGGRVFGNK